MNLNTHYRFLVILKEHENLDQIQLANQKDSNCTTHMIFDLNKHAPKKQIESFEKPQRMNWSWLWLRFGKNKKESNIIEGEAKEISEDDDQKNS